MYIHLKSKRGMYSVLSYNKETITVRTNVKEAFTVNVDDFDAIAGGMHNFNVTEETKHTFLNTISGKYREKDAQLRQQQSDLLAELDMQERMEKEAMNSIQEHEQYAQEQNSSDWEDWFKEESESHNKTKAKYNELVKLV